MSTLSEIVERAVRRKAQWCPPTLEVDDLRQEAWGAVLEAQSEGVIDPDDLQRRAELRIKDVIRAASNGLSVPLQDLESFEEIMMAAKSGRRSDRRRLREEIARTEEI